MTELYAENFRLGLEYQDFVFEQLRHMDGMPIFLGAYASQKYQNERGESPSGIEIKYDRKFRQTGNLYIEVAEKSDAQLPNYTLSGVMREDNSWLYLIGDYDEAFIFPKVLLRVLCRRDNSEIKYCELPTSQGYLFPLDYVQRKCLCAKHILFDRRDVD